MKLYRVMLRDQPEVVIGACEWQVRDGWLIATEFQDDGLEVESARFPEASVCFVAGIRGKAER